MSHRRSFLRQAAALGAGAALAPLRSVEEAFGAGLARVGGLPGREVGGGEGSGGPSGAGVGTGPDRRGRSGRGGWSPGDVRRLREEYLLDPSITYLNHGSIGTTPRLVREAHRSYLDLLESNPWLYLWGGEWEEPREEVRRAVARFVGCDPTEIALTHNTTEGFNLLSQGLPLGRGDEVLFSTLNHPGASVCWRHRAEERGFRVRRFAFPLERLREMSPAGVMEVHVERIRPETRVLVFPHVDNLVGVRHPVDELAREAKARGVEFVAVDGAQTVGMLPVRLGEWEAVDFYAASPHKWLQAPKGMGLLYVREEVRAGLRPMWVTWGQERWDGTVRVFEDYGTRNLPALLALGDAVQFQEKLGTETREARYRRLWRRLRAGTEATPGLAWRSPGRWDLSASLVGLEVRGTRSGDFFRRMFGDGGFVFRAFEREDLGLNTVRISPNLITTEGEIDRFFGAARRALGGAGRARGTTGGPRGASLRRSR